MPRPQALAFLLVFALAGCYHQPAAAESSTVRTAMAADSSQQLLPVEADSAMDATKPAEPWHLIGDRLAGTTDGSIEIDRPDIHQAGYWIRALKGVYCSAEKRLSLRGEVSVQDSSRVITAGRGFYYRENALIEMQQDVRGRGREGNFRCDRLTHNRDRELLALDGSVHLDEAGRILSSDWLRYDLADSFITAGGNLRLFEIADSIEAYGDRLFFDRAGGEATIVSDAARQPRLVHLASGGASPFVVHADTLKLWTSDRTGEAFGNVRFTRGNIWGSCGRAHLMMPEDQLLLVESPQVEDPDGWVAGDSMVVHLRDGRADKLVVWGRARSEYIPAERSGEVHFSQGDSLSAFMDAGEIQSVLIEGDAQALYLPSWLDAQRGIGLNWTRGNRMRIIMRDSGVRRVQFEGQVQGNYALPLSPGESDARAAAQRMSPLAYIRSCLGSETLQPTDSLLRVLEFNPEEVVEYEGDQIDFEVVTDQVMISGRAHMVYGDIQLFGEEIAFDASRDLITARGEPVLRDKDSEVHGTEMTYRIDNKKGLVFQGRSEFEGGYYRGERVKRVGKKVYFAQDGDFTTCEHDPPHFHFHAKKMKIVTGEKIFASPVVLYLGNVPVLPIPYAILPSRSGRQSGILIPEIEFGFDTNRGRFLRNIGYYYAPNDYMDGLFWLDYYEKNPRVTLNARARYRVRYLLSGGVDGSFTSEDVRGGGKRDRWLLNVNHNQTLGERFNLKVSGRFQSDKDYGADRDFGADVDERINRVLRSQMSLSKSWSGASMTLAADRTEYLDDSGGATKISQSIPSVNIALNSLPLGVQPDDRGRGGRLAFLSSTYLRAGMKFRSPYTETWGEGKVTTNQAAGLNASLSDKRRLLGRVNVTPSIRMSTAWARKDKDEQQQGGEGKKNCVGIVWQAGLSANSALYGTFFPRLGPWEGLRHVAEFSASYNYRPEIDHVENFPSVGGISLSSSKASSVSLGMTQRFHLKFSSGEETFKKENLIILSSRTSYDFLAKQKDREPWADLAHSLRLQPGKLLSSELSLTHDVKTWSRSRFQARTTLRMQGGGNRSGAVGGAAEEAPQHGGFGEPRGGMSTQPGSRETEVSLTGPWRFTATHVFSMGREWSSHRSSINLGADVSLTSGWRINYSVYYDLAHQEVASQGYSLTRDLHCWQASLERRMSGGRSSYYFNIYAKDLRDLKYERTRRE